MNGPITGISIIITSYNYGRFLSRTIASACEQRASGVELEIVIVDNASTDDSWQIICDAAAEDDRIRAFRNDSNIGGLANHHRGIELARMDRLLLLSADDYLLPGHVARIVAAHAEHPDIDYVFTSYIQIDESDRFLRFIGHVGHPRGSYFGGRNEFADLLTHDCYICASTTLFDRADLLANGSDDSIVIADYDHYLRLASTGATFAFIDVPGAVIRVHSAEVTGKDRYVATGLQFVEQLTILEKHLTASNLPKIAGREQGIANLVLAKLGNLQAYPGVAESTIKTAQSRVDAIFTLLNASRQQYLSTPVSALPLVSVIVAAGDGIEAMLRCIQSLAKQSYSNWELVLVADASVDAAPLLLDRARGLKVKQLHHAAPRGRAVSLNDGLTLANGEVVTYADADSEWTPTHLETIAAHFHASAIDALIVAADYETREGSLVANVVGSSVAQAMVGVNEGIPLAAFAHRRGIVDRLGRFDERLEHLVEFEFIFRMFSQVQTGLDPRSSVLIHEPDARYAPALRDPQGYLATLQTLYRDLEVAPEVTARRELHGGELTTALARGNTGRFAALTRGVTLGDKP
jgi:O-antigen biosynthesis protein